MEKKKILVIGGGFGGVFAAKSLEKLGRGQVDVQLINNNNYFVFQPLLAEVASGSINSSDAVVPLRQLLTKVQIRQAQVMGIDFKDKTVVVMQGARLTPVELPYDELVIALGTGVVFGMSFATVLGVFLIPFLYTSVQKIGERLGGKRAVAPSMPPTAPASH